MLSDSAHTAALFKYIMFFWLYLSDYVHSAACISTSSTSQPLWWMSRHNAPEEHFSWKYWPRRGAIFSWYEMYTETRATAALYIKQSSMWVAVCPNIAVLHSYLSLLMALGFLSSTFFWWRWREAATSGWDAHHAVNSFQDKFSINKNCKVTVDWKCEPAQVIWWVI